MIKLTKLPEPEVLKQNKAKWSSEYAQALADPDAAAASAAVRYRHPELKKAILQETHDKCAYCESKVTQVYPGDVEHILPKSKRPDLVVEWSNLTLACFECNHRKGEYFDAAAPLVNPYTDDPPAHLVFVGPFVFHRPGAHRGRLTHTVLSLNRAPLIERRKERLESLINLLDLHAKATSAAERDSLLGEIQSQAKNDREYSAMVATYLAAEGIAAAMP